MKRKQSTKVIRGHKLKTYSVIKTGVGNKKASSWIEKKRVNPHRRLSNRRIRAIQQTENNEFSKGYIKKSARKVVAVKVSKIRTATRIVKNKIYTANNIKKRFNERLDKVKASRIYRTTKYISRETGRTLIDQAERVTENNENYGVQATSASIKTLRNTKYILSKRQKKIPRKDIPKVNKNIKNIKNSNIRPSRVVHQDKRSYTINPIKTKSLPIKRAVLEDKLLIKRLRTLPLRYIKKTAKNAIKSIPTKVASISIGSSIKAVKTSAVGVNAYKEKLREKGKDDLGIKAVDNTSTYSYQTVRTGKNIYKTLKSSKDNLKNNSSRIRTKKSAIKTKKRTSYSNTTRIKTQLTNNNIRATRAIRTIRNKQKGIQRTVEKAVQATVRIAKTTSTVLLRAVVTGKLIIAIPLIIIIMTAVSVTNAFSSLPTTTIMADEKMMNEYNNKMIELQQEFQQRIEDLMNSPGYIENKLFYMNEEVITINNFKEIMCMMAVHFGQELEPSEETFSYMEYLFNLTNYIETETEYFTHRPGCTCPGHPYITSSGHRGTEYCHPGCECPGHVRLLVYVYNIGYTDILDEIDFNDDEKEWLEILLSQDFESLYPNMKFTSNVGSSGGLSYDEIQELLKNAPKAGTTRSNVVETALSLVGKVKYFWGGKSQAGWNDRWGSMVRVTAAGDRTTGTYQPYGLDCSGFTDWVYKTSGVGNVLSGGGTAYQWNSSYEISEKDVLPGDLVFLNSPGVGGVNHVGIYIGKDNNGKNLYVHCAGGQGVVVNSFSGFKHFRQAIVDFEDDDED